MNTKKTLFIVGSLIALFIAGLISTSVWFKWPRHGVKYVNDEAMANENYEVAQARQLAGFQGALSAPLGALSSDTAPSVQDKKIIRDASMQVEVTNVEKTRKALLRLAQELNGEILKDEASTYDSNHSAVWTVKILPGKLDEAVSHIEKIGKLQYKSISSQDITEEYVDTAARLESARKVEKRLTELMKFQTHKLADVLAVERELERIGEKIESMEGRIKYLNSLTSLSRLTLTYYEPVKETVQAGIGITRQIKNSFLGAANTFINTLSALIRFTGWLLAALSYVLFLCGSVGLAYWIFKKRVKCA